MLEQAHSCFWNLEFEFWNLSTGCIIKGMFDATQLRSDFPILDQQVNEFPLVYLDNAATSQKPQSVIDAISHYYAHDNANVHRGVHTLSDRSTHLFEESRRGIADFVGAQPQELILTRNTTEALNGVAYGWADQHLREGDVILTTLMEHHSNIVPWQKVCRRTGASLEFIEITKEGKLDEGDLEQSLKNKEQRIKLVALSHVSNTLGTVNPVAQLVKQIRSIYGQNVKIVIDGAQAVPHLPVNFDSLDADFYAFSGHKMLGPMGIGGLLIKQNLIDSGEFQPWLFGGGMIDEVHQGHTLFHPDSEERFLAGTPDVASASGLAEACRYLTQLDMTTVKEHDQKLVQYAYQQLQMLPEIQLVGPNPLENPETRIGSVAFLYQGIHAHDVAQILDSQGIAVRSGHHCCMPLHKAMGWQATVRASFQVYNTRDDVDRLVEGLGKVKKVFR